MHLEVLHQSFKVENISKMSINLTIDTCSLGDSGAIVDLKKCVKVEGGVVFSWVMPLYDTPLEIIFDKKNHVF